MVNLLKHVHMGIANTARLGLMKKPQLMNLYWESTQRCNLKCKHCFKDSGEGNLQEELTADEMKTQLSRIAKRYDANGIAFCTTGGELFLREDIFEVIAFADELGFKCEITTNGTLIDESVVRRIKNAGVRKAIISLDGNRETHDGFRAVAGSYDKAIRSVRLLKDADFLDALQVNTVYNKENLGQLRELYEIVKNSGATVWHIASIKPLGRASRNKFLLLDAGDYRVLFDFIKEMRKKRDDMEITYEHSNFLGLSYEFEVRDKCFICQAGIITASIMYNGDVFACNNIPRLPHLIQGNIRERDFCDIWENDFKLFREENRTSCGKCQKCRRWKYCYGGPFHTWDFEADQPKTCLEEIL